MRAVLLIFVVCLVCTLSGCGITAIAPPASITGALIQGRVHGGQQPVVNSHVYLFAANTTGYGNASVSLLNAAKTGNSDAIGAFVLTGSDGSFSVTGDYTCMQGTQVYLYALGGNPGAGTTNSAAGFLAILGNCPAAGNLLAQTPDIWVNEVSTIAAAYAMAGFAVDATHVSSSGSALAQIGIANAFANAANLATLSTGVALTVNPAGNAFVPQTEINTLANILASCVNSGSSGSTNCGTLFTNAKSGGSSGTTATDTATAAINIAHNPGTNVGTLYGIPPPAIAFAPALTATLPPNDFTIGLNFTGGGIANPSSLAIDGQGSAWISNGGDASVTLISSAGTFLSGTTGYTSIGLSSPSGIAIDGSGNAWVSDQSSHVVKISTTNGVLSGTAAFSESALVSSNYIAIDGAGNAWTGNQGGTAVFELSNAGAFQSTTGITGGAISSPAGMAIDGSGNAWVADNSGNNVIEISPSGSILSGTTGFIGGGISIDIGVAIDSLGNAWVTNAYPQGVTKLSNSGAVLFENTNGGISIPDFIAIDGNGYAWVSSYGSKSVIELSSSGVVLSGAVGFNSGGIISNPNGIAIDGSGNAWITDSNCGNDCAGTGGSVTELIGVGTPVITPICAGLPLLPSVGGISNLGTRP